MIIIIECSQDGQAMAEIGWGNMSLGISPDLRFKLEYYGSKQHVFNELELEGPKIISGDHGRSNRRTMLNIEPANCSRAHDKPMSPRLPLPGSWAFLHCAIAGTVQIDGGQLTFLVARSSSSQHDGQGAEHSSVAETNSLGSWFCACVAPLCMEIVRHGLHGLFVLGFHSWSKFPWMTLTELMPTPSTPRFWSAEDGIATAPGVALLPWGEHLATWLSAFHDPVTWIQDIGIKMVKGYEGSASQIKSVVM